MKRTTKTYFKNPSGQSSKGQSSKGQSSKESARHTPAPDTTPTGMDPAKKITGLVQTGGAVVGGQVAATVITTQALSMGGDMTRTGSLGHKVGSIALPIAIGALVGGLSKNKLVQLAGVGAVSAGVAAATNVLLKDKTPGFYPGDSGGYDYFAPSIEVEAEAEQLAGYYETLQLAAAPAYQPESYQVVETSQLA